MLRKRRNLIFMLLFTLIMVGLPCTNALAASKMDLYYYGTKENVSYSGQQVKYNYNGTAIDMGKTPGIIIEGTSLASYQDVFVKSAMKINYKYDKSKGKLTLSKGATTIVFTIGSKKATVNGKSVTLTLAPIKVKFKAQAVTKIMVPARFVAETFGYKYAWNATSSTSTITKPKSLFYNNKEVAYTGTEGQVTVDGKKISLGSMPSIIVSSTAMLRAKAVFSSSSIGAVYDFNKSTKKLTLTKGDKVVELTIGKTIAYVNGKARTMDTSPIVVKNVDTGTSYVMVPGSFVTSYLGYDYSWNTVSKTSVITSRDPEDEEDDDQDGPELGGDPLPTEDMIALNWGIQNQYLDEFIKINSINNTTEISNDLDSTANIYSIAKDTMSETNKETYSIHASTPFSKTTASLQNDVLMVHMNKAVTDNTSYYFGGVFSDVITTTHDPINLTSDFSFHLLYPNIKYELTLSEDRCTLYITLYANYVSNVTAGTKAGNDYVLITGMNELNVALSENGNYLTMQIPNTINGIGENYIATSSLNSLKSVQSTNIATNMINIILEKSSTSNYYITQAGNTYMITLSEGNIVDNSDSDLMIKLPTGVSFSDIQNEDRYYNEEIAIILPGDNRSYYQNNPLTSNNDVVSDVSVSYNDYNETEIIISTTKIQGYKLYEKDGYIGVTLGDPQDIYQNIVVLDAGHGGTDPGAYRDLNGVRINEKDVTFEIMYNKTKEYFNSSDSNIKVYYSRYDDTKVDLYDRAAFAEKVGADIFVSLHMNANSKTTVRGTDVYYSKDNNAMTSSGLTSKTLASLFLNYIPNAVGTTKRNVGEAAYIVNKYNTVPAVLIELGFMSNKADLSLMADDSFQDEVACAIYDVLCDVFDSYPTGR